MTSSPKRTTSSASGNSVSPVTLVLLVAGALAVCILIITASITVVNPKESQKLFKTVSDYVMLHDSHNDHHANHPTVATRIVDNNADDVHHNDKHPADRHKAEKAAQKAADHDKKALDAVHKAVRLASEKIKPLIKEHMENDAAEVAANRAALTCPPYDPESLDKLQIPLKHLPRKKKTSVSQKYDRRAHNCASNGVWNRVRRDDHHKILHNIVRLAKIPRSAYIFDWGSGCGHSMEWLFHEYNVTGMGVDVSKLTIEYARENTTKNNMYCVADGTKLDWIPSNTFDHAISFGSIYHVYNRTLFCHVLRQLVRIVRPVSGTVYNGWTENGEFKRIHVKMCLEDLPVHFDIHEEKKEFKNVEIFPLKAQQQEPNTYSLVIEKSHGIHDDEEKTKFKLENIPIACDDHMCVKRKDEKGMSLLAKRSIDAEKKKKSGKKAKKEKSGAAEGGEEAPPATTTTTAATEEEEKEK